MNVDLLPPTFERISQPHECGGCSSWREHGVYSGWCLMLSRPRGPMQTAEYIGRIEKGVVYEGRTLWLRVDGDDGLCFTPSADLSRIVKSPDGSDRYVSVTRTETAKSGQISGFEGAE